MLLPCLHNCKLIIIIIMSILNAALSAVNSKEAQSPKYPRSTFFSALFYTRRKREENKQYSDPIIHCAATLVSSKWLLTTKNCNVCMTWRVAVGLRRIPKRSIHRQKNYGIERVVDSVEGRLRLVEMDRDLDDIATAPAKIDEYLLNKVCFVASWMNEDGFIKWHGQNPIVSRKLQCNFSHVDYNGCQKYVGNFSIGLEETDICLVQKEENNPVAFCRYDIGAPVICNGSLVALVYFITNVDRTESGDCIKNKTGSFYPAVIVYPYIQWVSFFLKTYNSKPPLCCSRIALMFALLIFSIR